jgi:hypothetical protein
MTFKNNFMRVVIIILIMFFFIKISFSQTLATTNIGKKVILYENGAWNYAQQNEIYLLNNTECQKKSVGSVSFENKSDKIIYLYFGNWNKKQLAPGETGVFNNINDDVGYMKMFGYKNPVEYKILLDWAPESLQFKHINNYIENGVVYIVACKTIKIVIDDL